VPVSVWKVPPLAPSVTPRFVFEPPDKVNPAVVSSVPPFNVNCAAVSDAGTAPSPESADIATVPALIVVAPVKVFTPASVNVPLPFLVKPERLLTMPEIILLAPALLTVSAKPPPFKVDAILISLALEVKLVVAPSTTGPV